MVHSSGFIELDPKIWDLELSNCRQFLGYLIRDHEL